MSHRRLAQHLAQLIHGIQRAMSRLRRDRTSFVIAHRLSTIRDADLILVMEQQHIEAVTRIAPEVRGKTMLYGHWLKRDIPDPYRQSREAFEFTFDLIAEATQAWAQRLNK